MYGKANTRTFIAITCLSVLSITAVAGCKRLARRSNAGPTIPCEGTFRSERAPNGGPEHIVTGTVRTTPTTPVTVIDARLGQPMSVADASGNANFSMLINSALPSFVMFQCGVIGDRSRGYATASAPLRMAPRFLPLNTFNRLQCEGRELNVAFNGLSVSVSGEAGAQVTIDDRVLALAGAPQTVAYEFATAADGIPFGAAENAFWPDHQKLNIRHSVSVRFSDGTALAGTIFASPRDLWLSYSQHFSRAKQQAVLPASHERPTGGLLFSNTTLTQVFGPIRRPADVGYVAFVGDGGERRSSCGRYRRGAQIVQVDRVMHDGALDVYDPRTGQRIHHAVIAAPSAQCRSSMRSSADAMTEYSPTEANHLAEQYFAQRLGGVIPPALPFEFATATTAQNTANPAQPTGATATPTAVTDTPTTPPEAEVPRPDPSFAASLSASLGRLRMRVSTAQVVRDNYSSAYERTATISTDDDTVDLRFVDYSTVTPAMLTRVAVHSNAVTIIPLEETLPSSPQDVQALLAVRGNASAVGSALRRMRFTLSSAPTDDDEMDGVRMVSASITRGELSLNLYVRNYGGVSAGGDEPRAFVMRGPHVWIASGGSSRALLTRILQAVGR